MSVVAILQGTEKEDRQSTLTAVELARRLNTPVTGLFALPDPNAVLMVSATPEAAGLTASTAQSIIEADGRDGLSRRYQHGRTWTRLRLLP